MLAYFVVDCPPGIDHQALAKAISSWSNVETAYVEGGPTPPPVYPNDDPRWPNQRYLGPAPAGIDAEFAWTIPGEDGEGQFGVRIQFVDLEQGWTLDHEDLRDTHPELISGINQAYIGHGTAVLGQVVANDNTLGVVGITPRARARVVSQWRTPITYNTAEAILSAVDTLRFGDVLLVEAQTTYSGLTNLPVEVEPAIFDAIRLGVARGIVIVEASGNGANDLDRFTNARGDQILNRASTAFRDSGAIMVGAATSIFPPTNAQHAQQPENRNYIGQSPR